MSHPSKEQRGFTLIELLVVIAIIGILSSVILASLYLSRLKGSDAAIKSDLSTVQQAIELYYTNNNNQYGTLTVSQSSYVTTMPISNPSGNVFVADPTVYAAAKAALAQGGAMYYSVGQNETTYAIAVQLKGDTGYWWCVDSSNAPKREPASAIPGSGVPLGGGNSADAACPP